MTTPDPTAAEALRYRDERDALRARADAELRAATADRLTLATENGVLRDERDDLRDRITRLVGERDTARADLRHILDLREVSS